MVGTPPGLGGNAPAGQRQRLTPRAAARYKQQLNIYAYANGNMSPERRERVIVPALETLGYSRADAEEIAIRAPLNSSYTNEQAQYKALQYAASIKPGVAANQTPGQQALNAYLNPVAIAMPPRAQSAYQALQVQQQHPVQQQLSKGRFLKGALGKIVENVSTKVTPLADRVGNLASPGGLGSLFAVNLLFLFFAVPANSQGYTRAQLLWLTLMNKTKLEGETKPDPVPDNPLVDAAIAVAGGIEDVASAIGNAFGVFGDAASIAGTVVTGGSPNVKNAQALIKQAIDQLTAAKQLQNATKTCGTAPTLAQGESDADFVNAADSWLTCIYTNYGQYVPEGGGPRFGTKVPQPVSAPPTNTGRNAPPPSNVITRAPSQIS